MLATLSVSDTLNAKNNPSELNKSRVQKCCPPNACPLRAGLEFLPVVEFDKSTPVQLGPPCQPTSETRQLRDGLLVVTITVALEGAGEIMPLTANGTKLPTAAIHDTMFKRKAGRNIVL